MCIWSNNIMNWRELRYLFAAWSVENINQLYIDMIEEQEKGYY